MTLMLLPESVWNSVVSDTTGDCQFINTSELDGAALSLRDLLLCGELLLLLNTVDWGRSSRASTFTS